MSDLIDRTETIRAWCKLTCGCNPEECGMTIENDGSEECEFVEFLWNRPEAEEIAFDEWCTDCKEYDQNEHCCPRFNRVIRKTVEEAHSEKHGHWIKQTDENCWWYECSECGDYPMKNAYGHEELSAYCPHCGARMNEVEK